MQRNCSFKVIYILRFIITSYVYRFNFNPFQNLLEAESLDNFNMPLYFPTVKELKKVIQEEGSFSLKKLEVFEIGWDSGFSESGTGKNNDINNYDDRNERGKYISDYMRAVAESILVKQFGETIMEELFKRFAYKVTESMAKEKWLYVNFVISLTKKQQA